MIQTIKIEDTEHYSFKTFIELYKTSFPIFEQRTEIQQNYAFSNEHYNLNGYYDNDDFIGFISYWEFDSYIYIEHFAINTNIRGKGYGSSVLNSFISSTNKVVLLEIDPVIDNISAARLRFYKKCGFFENSYPHKHPAYRNEFHPHDLIILTTQREISKDEYNIFNTDLKNIIMK